MQGAELATIHSSVQRPQRWCRTMVRWMSRRIVLLAVALCLWIAPQLKGYQPGGSATIRLISSLLLAGNSIGRGVFLWFAYDRGDGRRKLISNKPGFLAPVLFISASLTCHNWSSNYDNQEYG